MSQLFFTGGVRKNEQNIAFYARNRIKFETRCVDFNCEIKIQLSFLLEQQDLNLLTFGSVKMATFAKL